MDKNEQVLGNEPAILYGKNTVVEYLKSDGQVDTLYLADDMPENNYIVALAKEKGAVVKHVHPAKLAKLCASERHQGVALSCLMCAYVDLNDIFQAAHASGRPPFLIFADGIADPHNLGAIIRSAECAGAHGVVIPKRNSCGITPTVYHASAGACSHMRIARVSNLASAIRDTKKRGVFCYCADASGQLCYDTDLKGAVALVIGSEGYGVSRLVRELCDGTVRIPLFGAVNSLNASVAAGVLMYEVVRQSGMKEADSV